MSSQCKVDSVRDQYDIYGLDDRLVHRYQNLDEGVRQLETVVNEAILRRAMEQTGMTVLDGEEENYYRLLTSEDVMDSSRKEARRDLADNGVDVERIEKDFVSYRTVLKHLKECLEVDTSRNYEPDIERDKKRISKVKSRAKTVMNNTLERLDEHDAIHIDDPRVSLRATVRCGQCNRRHDVDEFLGEDGVCECQKENMITGDEQASEERTAQSTFRANAGDSHTRSDVM
ncbi:MAG: rod-determining factor RdfA [Halorientalis sp.]